MRAPYKCSRCGLLNPMGTTTCMSCGASLTGVIPTQPAVSPIVAPTNSGVSSPVPVPNGVSAFAAFGWKTLDGRVIHVDVHTATPDPRWGRLFVKVALLGAAVYLYGVAILVALSFLFVVSWLFSKILPQGLLSGVAVQVISFLLTRRLMGPMANVPVRDVRLRDSSGDEHLVRLKGHLVLGSVAVGDEIIAEGWERKGMLLFRRGFNKRIGTAINIKPQ